MDEAYDPDALVDLLDALATPVVALKREIGQLTMEIDAQI